MEKNIVVQSNELVLAAYTMTTKEKQLFLTCVSQIDSREDAPIITRQTRFSVKVEDMQRLFYKEGNKGNVYRDLEQASDYLYLRDVVIPLPDNKKLRTRLVSGVLYDPDAGKITITFAEDILPYLVQLKANFTKYKLIDIAELNSIHSIRLYELVVCWLGQYQYSKKMTLDDFRYVMGLEGKYKQFSSLRERVIEIATKEINSNTNYTVSFEYHQRGKGKGIKELTLSFHKDKLNDLVDKTSGTLSQATIQSIANNPQFMADYNDHPSLSYEARMQTTVFKEEMFHIIQREPETFNKKNKDLRSYLPKIKQG